MKLKNMKSVKLFPVFFFSLMTMNVFAQEEVVEEAEEAVEETVVATQSFSDAIFSYGNEIVLVSAIIIALAIAFMILKQGKKVTAESDLAPDTRTFGMKLMDWLGGHNTKEELEKLDLHHDYDGIGELDNNIPAWWTISWIGTIIFGVVYLIRVFITGGIPDQIDELREAQRVAAVKVEQVLSESTDLVDENTVEMLGAEAIANGKVLYDRNCIACHGEFGEGGPVGPNLADEYWLHGGSINDIFYSIKYGWPENGMISWQSLFSPMEIAEISSYVKSLGGTNPPNAKDPEGELYTGE